MLQFFRKYQKIFFIFTTFVIVISFSFFGTFNAMGRGPKENNRKLATSLAGKPIMESDVRLYSYFLQGDHHSVDGHHFLDDGVMEKDFIKTGLAKILAEHYFDLIQDDVKSRMEKVHSYKPYVNSKLPFFTAANVWGRFAPEINQKLEAVQKMEETNSHAFSLLADLYDQQTGFPPAYLKYVLQMQEKKQNYFQPDPALDYMDLHLFGFHSLSDWFGPKFMEIVAEFIINAACYAEQKGYVVSEPEVKAALLQNVYNHIHQRDENLNMTYAEINEHMQSQLQMLGISEAKAIEVWKSVMLFRRLFYDVGAGSLLGRFEFEEFASYSGNGICYDAYELPQSFKMNNFWDLVKFEFYLQAVSSMHNHNQLDALSLSRIPKDPFEVQRKFPEFVQKRFLVEYKHIDKNEVIHRIPLKQIWDYELDEHNFKKLKENFPELQFAHAKERNERFEALEKLPSDVRARVDHFAQIQILDQNPSLIREELAQKPAHTEVIKIRMKGGHLPFIGVENRDELIDLFEKYPLSNEGILTEDEKKVKEQLVLFSKDDTNYYSIHVVKAAEEKEIVPYADLKNEPELDALVSSYLETFYPNICRQKIELFLNDTGDLRPFEEVKNQVGSLVFANLLHLIEDDYEQNFSQKPTWSSEDERLAFYAKYRLYNYVKEAKRFIENDPDHHQFVASFKNNENDLSPENFRNQFRLVKNERKLTRSARGFKEKEALFSLQENQLSSIEVGSYGNIEFCRITRHYKDRDFINKKVEEGQQLLSHDGIHFFMHRLLQQIKNKNAIAL